MSQTSIFLQSSENPRRRQILWSYLQHELLYLTWILMEVALLTPFVVIVLPLTRPWSSGLLLMWLLLLMYLPFNLVRLMSTLDWPRSRQQFILAVAILLIYLFTLRTLFFQPASWFDFRWIGQLFATIAEPENTVWLQSLGWFVLVVFVWWRGLRLIGKSFSINSAGRRLRVGALLIIPLVIALSINYLPWSIVPFILLFFFVSLTAVALARVEEIEKQQSGLSASINPKWLLSVGLAALLLVVAGAFSTFIVSGQTMLAIAKFLDPLQRAIYTGGIIVFDTVVSLLEPILRLFSLVIEFLVGFLTPIMAHVFETPPSPNDYSIFPTPEATAIVAIEEGSKTGFKTINILLMIAIMLAVTLALGRVYRQAEFAARDSEAATKTIANSSPPRLNFGQRLLNRLGLLHGWRTAASIRRIYQNMCRAAAINGYARAEAETPFEYLVTLSKAWPENQADTHLITETYVKIRYGELPESSEELEALRAAWKRLETTPPIDQNQAQKHKVDLDRLR